MLYLQSHIGVLILFVAQRCLLFRVSLSSTLPTSGCLQGLQVTAWFIYGHQASLNKKFKKMLNGLRFLEMWQLGKTEAVFDKILVPVLSSVTSVYSDQLFGFAKML